MVQPISNVGQNHDTLNQNVLSGGNSNQVVLNDGRPLPNVSMQIQPSVHDPPLSRIGSVSHNVVTGPLFKQPVSFNRQAMMEELSAVSTGIRNGSVGLNEVYTFKNKYNLDQDTI